MAGSAPIISGNDVYVTTGNGPYSNTLAGGQFGNSVVRLSLPDLVRAQHGTQHSIT